MKKLGLLLVLLLSAMPVGAQRKMMRVDVPFEFGVAERTLPAGTYLLQDIDGSRQGLFTVASRDSAQTVVVQSSSREYRGPVRKGIEICFLVFRKYGEEYFLGEIWHPDQAFNVLKSRAEREYVSSRVVTDREPVRVIILAASR